MISSVRGPVLSALGSIVVIEVGGIGLALQVTPGTALSVRIGDEARLVTTLIVREDSLTLYGFTSAEELAVFELLVGVTGVGPKSALGVLAALTPNQIAQAVTTENDAAFRKVSGIGPKTAKLIVVSLAGKVHLTAAGVGQGAGGGAAHASSSSATVSVTVQAALIGLGWSERVAAEAVEETLRAAPPADQAVVATILRLSLARLGPAQHSVGRRS
ncbi:Holliday junction branch migration protein RuvA [Leifsonia kafniensis]|uniref:Holliday junction branch migration complex subunit RuvA n=1 Tax=Leifsonia kafniensis TaxID=475957 RepID=A0ABP7K5D1_9MICO